MVYEPNQFRIDSRSVEQHAERLIITVDDDDDDDGGRGGDDDDDSDTQ